MLEAAGQPVAKEISLPKATSEEMQPAQETQVAEQTISPEPVAEEAGVVEKSPEVAPADYSLTDKIKLIVKENPHYGAYKIKRALNSTKFGYTRVGWFEVRSYLVRMQLNSRSRRFEFSASI